jgi:hypothetical protein
LVRNSRVSFIRRRIKLGGCDIGFALSRVWPLYFYNLFIKRWLAEKSRGTNCHYNHDDSAYDELADGINGALHGRLRTSGRLRGSPLLDKKRVKNNVEEKQRRGYRNHRT